jgi:hypothetical protein
MCRSIGGNAPAGGPACLLRLQSCMFATVFKAFFTAHLI